ncbi:MAG: PAS domain S-box protein [Candidatus Methanoperedens sp.]|nr:PAS domain S-box protein [Candidatus Methanoperedens sp.]
MLKLFAIKKKMPEKSFRLSIGKKILLGFSILIFIYLGMALRSYSDMNEISALAGQAVPLSYQITSLQEFAVSLESLERDIDKFFTVNYKENQEEVNKDLDEMHSIIRSVEKNADSNSIARLQEMERIISEIQINFNYLVNLEQNNTNSREINEKRILVYELINSGRQKHRELLLEITNKIQVNVLDQQRVISNIIKELIMLGISILMFGVLLSFLTSRSISRPVEKLRAATTEIGQGRLNVNIPIQSNDEIGQLASAFNKMTEELQKTTVSKDYVENIIRSMFDTLVVATPDGTIQKVNKAICDLLGYRSEELIGRPVDILFSDEALQPESSWLDELLKKGSIINIEKTYLTKDGRKIPVLFSVSTMCDDEGNILGIVCVAKDVTERKLAEDKIKGSLQEKEMLLREIHHRVKNNMAIVSGLLAHQSQYTKDKNVIDMFTESQNRILAMSLVHEKLYQSNDLAKIDFNEYFCDMVADLIQSYEVDAGKITLKMNIENIPLDIDFAIPCGLITNELVTNSLKYAFPAGTQGEIKIAFRSIDENMLELVVSDNGIGIPKDLDFRKTESLGLHLVTTLAENQLHGEINLNRSKGTEFQIKFRGIK